MCRFMQVLRRCLPLTLALLTVAGLSCTEEGTVNPIISGNTELRLLAAFSATPPAVGVGAQATIAALLVNGNGEPVPGEPVSLSARRGSIAALDSTTDTGGAILATYTGSATVGTDTVIAVFVDGFKQILRDTLYISVSSFVRIALSAADTLLIADGLSAAPIVVVATDPLGQRVANQAVYFRTTHGTIPAQTVTSATGSAFVTLTTPALTASATALIQASTDPAFGGASAMVDQDSLQMRLIGVSLTLTSSLPAIETGGGQKAVLTATLTTRDGAALPSRSISFTTNLGLLSATSGITDVNGRIAIQLTAGAATGLATIQASYGTGFSVTTGVNFFTPASTLPARLVLTATPSRILADGAATASLRAMAYDSLNNLVPDGTQVEFAILDHGSGSVVRYAVTAAGAAVTTLTAGLQPDTVQVRAFAGAAADTVTVTYGSGSLQLTPADLQIIANGVSQTTIRVVLRNENNNPDVGVTVQFSTTLGTIAATAVTNAEGVATVTLRSETTAGTAVVTAQTGNLSTTASVLCISPLLAPVKTIILSAIPDRLLADGVSISSIRAIVLDSLNNAVQNGTPVQFVILPGGTGTITGVASTLNGEVTVTLKAGFQPDTVSVQAFSGNVSDTVIVIYGSRSLSVTANPIQINADGISISTISAVVRNELNNPVVGQAVSFSSTLGTVTASATTNANGVATATLTSDRRNGVAVITAQLGTQTTQTSVTLAGVTITLNADPASALADGIAPVAVTGILRDAAGNPIIAAPVQMSASLGTLRFGSGITSNTGAFVDTVRSNQTGSAIITMTGAGATGSTTVQFTGYSLSITATPASIVAGVDTAEITATLLGENTAGVETIFSSDFGTLVAQESMTDAVGMARARFISSGAGTAQITVTARRNGSILTEKSIAVTVQSAPPAAITLTVSRPVLQANGETATLKAIVTDATGNRVTGASVSFSRLSGPGDMTLLPLTAVTNTVGEATSVITSGGIGSTSRDDIEIRSRVQGTSIVSNSVFLTIAGKAANIALSISSPTDLNDGNFQISITAIVTDVTGAAVLDGTQVFFSAIPTSGTAQSIGIITNGTTATGRATGTLVYPSTDAGKQVAMTARTSEEVTKADTLILPGAATDIVELRFQAPSSKSILADGTASTTITVVALDAEGDPVANRIVNFSYVLNGITFDAGFDQTNPLTDAAGNTLANGGQASVSIVSAASTVDLKPILKATADNVAATLDTASENAVTFRGIDFRMRIAEDTLQVNETATVTINLKETTTQVAITNRTITLGTSVGSIVQTATTNTSGVATTSLNAGDVLGTAIVTATMGNQLVRRDTVVIIDVIPAVPAVLNLTTNQSVLAPSGFGGIQQATITATITDSDGDAVTDGTSVRFSTNLGTFSNGDTTIIKITSGGTATAVLTSGTTTGEVRITATATPLSVTRNLISIRNNPLITLSTTGAYTDLGNGLRTTTVTALLKRYNDQLVGATNVTWTLSDFAPVGLSANPTTTANGITTATLTYPSVQSGTNIGITTEASIDGIPQTATLYMTLP